MAAEAEEQDIYVGQLKELFHSCDSSGTGYLGRLELEGLCSKLQIEEHSNLLLEQLLEDGPDSRVGFDDFKDGFVSVLSENIDGFESSEEEDNNDRLSPKYVKGDKKYGRRTRPEREPGVGGGVAGVPGAANHTPKPRYSPQSPAALKAFGKKMSSLDSDTTERGSGDRSLSQSPLQSPGPPPSNGKGPPSARNSRRDKFGEMFESEGQLDPFLTKAMDPVSEEQHLKDIWHELGVGQSGYLTIAELATVCEHIGMDEMNRAELQQLFDKLDVDADSRVSFQEFLQGLFQHGGPSSPATPVRPLSSTRQKLRLSAVPIMEESRLTPSLLSATPALLTPLDPDNVGYAKADAIIELWENLGIPQGAEILEYLQFDVAAKVNLIDLSYALEQELRGVEEDNAIYHAGLVSYQYQLKHLMSHGEQLTAERDKLRADLGEAHGRIALLVKEGDERHTALERSRDKDVKSVERRYQEQIKALQNELDQEREVIVHQTSRQRQYLEAEIERLKDEESKLKDKLAVTQKELDRLESEVLDMAERCNEMERQNLRQQRELEATADIQHKLEELESNREVVRDEQEKFSEQKLLQLELENKDLKDRSDELTMELQELRQVASGTQRQHVRSRRLGSELAEPQLGGSVLSDYVTKTRQDSPEGHSEDDAASATSSGTSSRTRRRLPLRPSESGTSAPGDGELRDRFQLEMEVLRMESARVHEENETLQLEIHQLSVEKESWLEHQAKLEAERDGLLSEKLDLSQHRDAFLKDKTDLSEERDALLKDKIGLSEEREGLLKDKTCFSEERDALLKDKIGLSEERDILLKDKTCLSEEREGLLKDKIDLSEERNILLKDKTCLSEERDALLKDKKDLGEERESLLKAKDALEAECECLVKEKTAVTVERDGLLRERNKLRKEHDELVTDKQLLEVERRTVVKDRDQVEEETELLVRETERLQQELTSLTKEKAFLEEENDHLQGERDRLDGEAELANLKVNTIQREKDGLQANLEDLQRQLAVTRDDSEVKVKVKDSHLVRFQGEMEELQREKEVLVTQHVSEVGALQRALSTDRKDLEDSFKMEIALIEDRHIQEKNDFLKKFKLEKEKQEAEQAVRLQESLEQQEEELKKTFQAEKEDLVIKAESEKNLIRHKFEEEKTALIDSLKRESSRELDEKLREQRQEHITQLEATVSRDRSDSDSLRQQRAQLEQQLRVQRDDMEAERSRERASLLEQADRERSDLLERQRRELAEYDAMLTKGTDGLRGQLKVDFYRLLDEERRLVAESERARVESECEALRERLESEVKGERVERDSQALRDRLQREHQLEVDRLKEELEREKKWMTLEMEREKKEWEKEKERLRGDAERERGSFTRRVEKERDSLSKCAAVAPLAASGLPLREQVTPSRRESAAVAPLAASGLPLREQVTPSRRESAVASVTGTVREGCAGEGEGTTLHKPVSPLPKTNFACCAYCLKKQMLRDIKLNKQKKLAELSAQASEGKEGEDASNGVPTAVSPHQPSPVSTPDESSHKKSHIGHLHGAPPSDRSRPHGDIPDGGNQKSGSRKDVNSNDIGSERAYPTPSPSPSPKRQSGGITIGSVIINTGDTNVNVGNTHLTVGNSGIQVGTVHIHSPTSPTPTAPTASRNPQGRSTSFSHNNNPKKPGPDPRVSMATSATKKCECASSSASHTLPLPSSSTRAERPVAAALPDIVVMTPAETRRRPSSAHVTTNSPSYSHVKPKPKLLAPVPSHTSPSLIRASYPIGRLSEDRVRGGGSRARASWAAGHPLTPEAKALLSPAPGRLKAGPSSAAITISPEMAYKEYRMQRSPREDSGSFLLSVFSLFLQRFLTNRN